MSALVRRTRASHAEKVIDGVGGSSLGCACGSSGGDNSLWRTWRRERGISAGDSLSSEINDCRGGCNAPVAEDSEGHG